MARPRTPTNVLQMRGAFKNHPGRAKDRANEPIVTAPIGEPPKTFTGDQLKAWEDIVGQAPKGVMTAADTIAVELAARLLAQERSGVIDSTNRRLLANMLGKFGMTPSDRSKVSVSVPTPTAGNPFGAIG